MSRNSRFTFLFLVFISALRAAPGDLDSAFMATVDKGFSEPINAVAILPDGTILAGGNLGQFQGANDGVLWRLNADGSLHSVWGPFADSQGEPEVDAIRVQPDGKVLVGGVFTSVDGQSKGGLVRLNADGSVDASFASSGVNGSSLRYVNDIELQADGKIVIAGGFTSVNNTFRMSVARLHSDGSLDTGFVPPTFHSQTSFGTYPTSVDDVDLQPDGGVVLAGAFNLINSTLAQSGAARLRPDGSLDLSFAVGAGSGFRLNHCKVLPDGGVLFGGLSGTYQGTPVQGFFKVDEFGALDTAFNANLPTINGWVGGDIVLQPDGMILAAGIFNDYGGDAVSSIVRLHPDGTRDLTFETVPYTTERGQYGTHMYAVAVQADGKIVVGGWMNEDDGLAGTGLGIQINGTKIYNLVRFEGDYSPGPGNLAFTTPGFWAVEGDGTATISVVRYGGVTGAVSVNLSTSAGTATAGSDFSTTSETLSWADGEGGVRTVSIALLDDDVVETEEGVLLGLSSVTGGATLTMVDAVLGIFDDDGPPLILVDPFDLSIIQGNSGMLTVAAWSTTELSYQWRKDGEPITGGIYPWLPLYAVDESDAGDYDVVVSNANGSVTSATATVTVSVPPGSLDPSFLSRLSNGLSGHAPDGSGGYFGVTTNGVWRLQSDGTIDAGFSAPSFDANGGTAYLFAVASANDGTVLVGGDFTHVDRAESHRLVRLLSDGTIDPSFTSPFDANTPSIRTMEVAADGSIYVGFYRGGGIVRLANDGTIDTGFNCDDSIGAGINGSVSELLIQSDGKVLVCHLDNSGFGSFDYRFSRLNADGSIDASFAEPDLSWTAEAVDLLPDGRIAIAGRFQTVNGEDRARIAILHPDGTLDIGFDPGAGLNSPVWALRFHAGQILVAGEFTSASGVDLNRIARYRLDGTLDPDFNPGTGPNGKVEEIIIDAEGRTIISGGFNAYNGITSRGIVRLVAGPSTVGMVAGTLEATETSGTISIAVARYGDAAEALSIDWTTVDGSAVAPADYGAGSGTLTWAAGESGERLIELDLVDDGSMDGDLGFSVSLGEPTAGSVFLDTTVITIKDDESLPQISVQPQSVQTVLGLEAAFSVTATSPTTLSYQWYHDGAAITGATSATLTLSDVAEFDEGQYQVRLTNDYGAWWSAVANLTLIPDPTLLADGFVSSLIFNNSILALAPTPDGGAVIGGQFTDVNGNTDWDYLARVNADGSLDTSFVPPTINGNVFDVAVQPDGKVLIAGFFSRIDGVSRRGVVRLEADGSVDATFAANMGEGTNGNVRAVELLPDGRIVVGGGFSSWDDATLYPYRDLILLNPDGSLDAPYFKTSGTASILDIRALPDGRILASHDTTSSSAAKVTRYGTDRIADNTFTYASGRKEVEGIGLAADGDYLFTGVETLKVNPDGTTDTVLLASNGGRGIVAQRNGKIVVGGGFNGYLKRFLASGETDPTFAPASTTNGWVQCLGLRVDGKIWIGGAFTSYNGTSVNRLALLNGDAVSLAFTGQPSSVVADAGEHVTFEVGAVGTSAIAYQWYREGTPLTDGGIVSGASTASLLLSGVTEADEGVYECIITNESGSLTSESATLVVLGAPEFQSQSGDVSQLAGNTLELTAEVIGAGTLSYEWRRNGVALNNGGAISGADSAALSIVPAGIPDSGTYTLVVSNSEGTTTSDPIEVEIESNPAAMADGFVGPTVDGNVYAILPLDNGQVLVGGTFNSISDGTTTSGARLAVLNADGTVEDVDGLSASGDVQVLLRDGAGKILVGGFFGEINGEARSRIARLHADLTLDTTFDPQDGPGWAGVNAIEVTDDGGIFVGGTFPSWNGASGTAYLCRLDETGAVDPAFTSTINSYVYGIEAVGNQVYVSGIFSNVDGDAATTTDNYLVRLNGDGSLDTSFAASHGGYSGDRVFVSPDGSVYAGSVYTSYFGRYDSSGNLDTDFGSSRFGGRVRAMAFDVQGRTYFGGYFTLVSTESSPRLARLTDDDALDTGFAVGSGFDATVEVVTLAPDGSVWVGGLFTSYNGVPAQKIVRLTGESSTLPEGTTFADYAATVELPAGLDGPNDDANSNGLPNLLDFLLGLDASDPASSFSLEPSFATGEELGMAGDSALYLTVEIAVRADVAGLEWGVEMCPTLPFDESSEAGVVVGTPVEADGMATYTFRAPWSADEASAVFFRLWGDVLP